MLDTIVSIILFIVAFGILICIHEAGHLSMAKLFKVYCKEYSIGFGPALFSRKKEGHETKFSIRAIPFGGYVSMYGEGMEDDPELKDIPPERSLEGIKKWKKAIVLSAGVILNAVLALILIFISNVAFPVNSLTRQAVITESSLLANEGVTTGDHIEYIYPSFYEENGSLSTFAYQYEDSEKIIHSGSFFIVDEYVSIPGHDPVVLTYIPNGDKKEPVFTEGIVLYEAITKDEFDKLEYPPLKLNGVEYDLKKDFKLWSEEENAPTYYPNFQKDPVVLDQDSTFLVDLAFKEKGIVSVSLTVKVSEKGNKTINSFENIGLSFKMVKHWLPFGTRLKNTFIDFGDAAGAVFEGLGILFKGGFRNMSGIVGIFDQSASLYSQYTFSTYLFFWGLISINLAIFNLLPFPGLDGWQLLVTAIEGISKKKIPAKLKTIMSLIGLGLLFTLMILIVVFDILRIVGV